MTPDDHMTAYQQALRAHDLDAAMALIGPDAVFWFSTGAAHAGHDAICAAIAANFDAIKLEDYRLADLSWVVPGSLQGADAAACTYAYHWSGVIDGPPSSGKGRGTNVLARDAAGRWSIVHEHLSAGPAA